jgi:hypothetical protein
MAVYLVSSPADLQRIAESAVASVFSVSNSTLEPVGLLMPSHPKAAADTWALAVSFSSMDMPSWSISWLNFLKACTQDAALAALAS